MKSELEEVAARVRAYRALGGVDLGSLDPEERSLLLPEIHTGTAHLRRAVYRFRCPECGCVAENDQAMEPMCTGPNWTNDHPPEVMVFLERRHR